MDESIVSPTPNTAMVRISTSPSGDEVEVEYDPTTLEEFKLKQKDRTERREGGERERSVIRTGVFRP